MCCPLMLSYLPLCDRPATCLLLSCFSIRRFFALLRSVKATAFDQIYCMQLAQNAVHGAMAGYTAFSAGVVNNRTVRLVDTPADTHPFLSQSLPSSHTFE